MFIRISGTLLFLITTVLGVSTALAQNEPNHRETFLASGKAVWAPGAFVKLRQSAIARDPREPAVFDFKLDNGKSGACLGRWASIEDGVVSLPGINPGMPQKGDVFIVSKTLEESVELTNNGEFLSAKIYQQLRGTENLSYFDYCPKLNNSGLNKLIMPLDRCFQNCRKPQFNWDLPPRPGGCHDVQPSQCFAHVQNIAKKAFGPKYALLQSLNKDSEKNVFMMLTCVESPYTLSPAPSEALMGYFEWDIRKVPEVHLRELVPQPLPSVSSAGRAVCVVQSTYDGCLKTIPKGESSSCRWIGVQSAGRCE